MDTIVEQSGIDEAAGSGRTRQRRSAEEKLRIVLETLKPGVSVPVVARRHCVNANQLFMWRSQYRRGELVARAIRFGLIVAVMSVRRNDLRYPTVFRRSQRMKLLRVLSIASPHSGQRSPLRPRWS